MGGGGGGGKTEGKSKEEREREGGGAQIITETHQTERQERMRVGGRESERFSRF